MTTPPVFFEESKNCCVSCGADMGDNNDRQLCGKTVCYERRNVLSNARKRQVVFTLLFLPLNFQNRATIVSGDDDDDLEELNQRRSIASLDYNELKLHPLNTDAQMNNILLIHEDRPRKFI